jgi:hypothetical protein
MVHGECVFSYPFIKEWAHIHRNICSLLPAVLNGSSSYLELSFCICSAAFKSVLVSILCTMQRWPEVIFY